ncbi:hypothetical protein PV327_004889 [Microctonus hyperodae]|uniref:Transcription factor CBF/NF-Y/archaeal histone domain-containing protein n=1 Tax=Microctonus hyperodae TaxID=165561 RepID=A0AA39FDD2_MICHY|nr:hypothetical protein PV327_004889 [Microctonus hyperodae]
MENISSMEESPILEQLNVPINENEESQEDSQEQLESIPIVDEEQKEKLLQLPMGRIRNIAKMDPDVNLMNQEAVFLIAKSTELFIDSLAKEAYRFTVQCKKKTVQKKDVEQAIDNIDELAFLEGMLGQCT